MRRSVLSFLFVILSLSPAAAISSECFALAGTKPNIFRANYQPMALNSDQVRLNFLGHSSFIIESPGGSRIVTDYYGNSGGIIPDGVTMNQAHRTHYTDTPDPLIKHVLRGWKPEGGRAVHNVEIGDIRVRNVTTDLHGYSDLVKDGNSIFIFEVAGLCIGHLGHLHHLLGPEYIGQIGRLDVLMVPVDGGYTLNQTEMVDVLRMLKTRVIIPMHYFGPTTLNSFISMLDDQFKVEFSSKPDLIVSMKTLPAEPTVIVLPGN